MVEIIQGQVQTGSIRKSVSFPFMRFVPRSSNQVLKEEDFWRANSTQFILKA